MAETKGEIKKKKMDLINSIESGFDRQKAMDFMGDYWHYSFYISAVYVVTIFGLQNWMKNRERYELRVALFCWSLLLALFSIRGFMTEGVEHVKYLIANGWEGSVCHEIVSEGSYGLWAFLFCFSKGPELVDTYFIVFRKQKLIFLHWYHHVTVFIYCWYHYAYLIYPAQWFITMNYFVHSIMYSYYAIRASGLYRPPTWVNMVITGLQLAQMVAGVYINYFLWSKMADPTWYCDGKVEKSYLYVIWSFAMYFSYFVLFSNFFFKTYCMKKSGDRRKEGQEVVHRGGETVGVSSEVPAGLGKRKQVSKMNGSVNGISHKDP